MAAVWYIGPGERRLIVASDWTRRGVSGDDTEWNSSNGWSTPHDEFTAAQLGSLAADPEFIVGAPDGPRDGATIPPPDPGGEFPDPDVDPNIYVISEIDDLVLRFGPGPLPDPASMPKTIYFIVPT
jgi:hypothetical protein